MFMSGFSMLAIVAGRSIADTPPSPAMTPMLFSYNKMAYGGFIMLEMMKIYIFIPICFYIRRRIASCADKNRTLPKYDVDQFIITMS